MIAMRLAYQLFCDEIYNEWYKHPEAYCDKYFVDQVDSVWYGYLQYDNTVSNNLKGNIFKRPSIFRVFT